MGGIWDSIWDFISSPIDFDTSGLPTAESISKEEYLNFVGRPAPSLIVSNSLRNQQNPLIIFEDSVRKLGAYEWQNNALAHSGIRPMKIFAIAHPLPSFPMAQLPSAKETVK